MPLKTEVLPHLANMDPLTARIGACNTLRMGADGKLYGFNTDVAGVVRPLERRMRLKGARVVVVGAGGAARAAVFGLVEQGAEVLVVNRTHEHAVTLARQAKAKSLKHELLAKQHFDVMINATPCGMAGSKQAIPITENELNASVVFDMVYNPLETPLLEAGEVARPSRDQRHLKCLCSRERVNSRSGRASRRRRSEMLRVVEHELRKRTYR